MSVPATMLRAFRRDELGPVPQGWTTGPPDFVGVGCGKAGTSWWHALVDAHPAVVANRLGTKELHYFPHCGWRAPERAGIELYREAFARPAGGVCGEWSGNYLYYPFALESLAEAAPQARLMAIVRNPVDRFVSLLNQYAGVRAGLIGVSGDAATVLETWSLFPEAAYQARIADGLARAIGLFGADRLLVLQYESCIKNPSAELARTYSYLGIDAGFVPDNLERPVNRRPYSVARPDTGERARIARWFADDVEAQLKLIPSLDRALWPDFA